MTARDGQIAALRDIADGLDHGLPAIHAVTIGMDPIRVQVNGDLAENVDRWLQFFDPAAKGAVTQRHWGSQGKDFYCGQVVIEEGATLEFWDAIPAPADDDLRAENERLRAELAALRAADVAPPAGDAVVAEVAAEATTAPDFKLGPVERGEHVLVSTTAGGPGGCGVECVCGVGFYGFDTVTEARVLLEGHMANPEPRDQIDPFHVLPDEPSDNSVHGEDLSVAVTGAEDVAVEHAHTYGMNCPVLACRWPLAEPDADGDLIAPVGEA